MDSTDQASRERCALCWRDLVLALLATVGGVGLCPPAQAQCGETVFFEDFESIEEWTVTGSWVVEPPPCLGTSQAPPAAEGSMGWVKPIFTPGSCTCRRHFNPCSGYLTSPPFLLPSVAPGETLLFDFDYTSSADTLYVDPVVTCNRVEVQSATQFSTFSMPTPLSWGCLPDVWQDPPYDITAYAGEVIWLTWRPALLDGEGKVTLLIDNVRVERVPAGPDCNGNGVPDACDIASGTSQDCNGNGIPDECDIASGTSLDFDGDGVPDECQCPNTYTYCVGAPNSAGAGASIGYAGSTSLTLNDLVLTAAGAVPGQFGIFFLAATETQTPFGDGFLCAIGSQGRLAPPVLADANGAASYAVDFTDASSPVSILQPLSSWSFQLWYRDPAAAGSGFNLSNALRLHLCP